MSQLPDVSDVNVRMGGWSRWRWPHQDLNTEDDATSKHTLNEL